MNTRKPTSNEIIRSLMALGFRVVGVRKRQTILENGRKTVRIPLRFESRGKQIQLKKQLEPFFPEESSGGKNIHIERVRQWLFAQTH